MIFSFISKGSFNKTESFLQKMMVQNVRSILEKHAQAGVSALAAATPRDSGVAAQSWGYKIIQNKNSSGIVWTNSDVENGFPVVIALQYGHGTGTGGYIQGRDFINPAIRPIFDQIAADLWKEVTSA